MRRPRHPVIWSGLLIAMSTTVGLVACFLLERASRSYHDSFALGDMDEWRKYGGTWAVEDGVLRNLSGGRGDKLVIGNRRWRDCTVQSEFRFDSDPRGTHWGDAGILLRVTNPAFGVDDYDGYYLGIEFDENSLILGRVNHAWERVRVVPLKSPARTSNWYRLRATLQGCHIDATVQEAGTPALTRLTYFDDHCTKLVGTVGVRVYSLQASWRDFAVHPE